MAFIRALPFLSIFPALFLCSCGDTVVESTGAEQMLKGNEINYGQITAGLSFTADTAAAWNYWQAYYCMEQDKQSSFFVQAINSKEYTNSDFISVMGY